MKSLLHKREVTAILVNLISIKMLLTFPRGLVQNAGNAAWLQVLYVSLISLILYFITIKIYERVGNRDVLDISELVGKKPLKILVGIVLTAILLTNMSMTMRAFPESIKTILLTHTNMGFIVILLAITIGIGAYLGLEALGRLHTIFLPIAGTVLVIFFLLAIPFWKVTNILPILGLGSYNIFVKGFHSVSLFADIIVLNLLLPYIPNYNDAKRSGFIAIIISAVVAFVTIGTYNLVYPYPASSEFIMPAYQISRIVKIGSFFQRWEAFFEFIWSISMYMYSAIYVVVIGFIIKKTFNLTYYKPLVFAIVAICATVSFLPESILDVVSIFQKFSYVLYPTCFLLPILLGLIYRIKTKRGEMSEKT